jgi:GcrA cell cycle regulator
MVWNDERIDLLKKLWAEGLSASGIASRLGDVSRNAVIGKVHRLGLPGRRTTSRSNKTRTSTKKERTTRPLQRTRLAARFAPSKALWRRSASRKQSRVWSLFPQ